MDYKEFLDLQGQNLFDRVAQLTGSFYQKLMGMDLNLMEDPTEEGEYNSLLYIQESLSRLSEMREQVTKMQVALNSVSSEVEKQLSSKKLTLRIMKNPAKFLKPEDFGANYTKELLESEVEILTLKLKELKLLDDAIKTKLNTLNKVNSDIRLQAGVSKIQIDISGKKEPRKSKKNKINNDDIVIPTTDNNTKSDVTDVLDISSLVL
jgi:hypothetical protein